MTGQRGCIPHIFDELTVNITAHGPLGASGETIEIAVAKNVPATLEFTYHPEEPAYRGRTMEDAHEGQPARVDWHAVRATDPINFDGLRMTLAVQPGYDLREFLSHRDIEVLEDIIITRAKR